MKFRADMKPTRKSKRSPQAGTPTVGLNVLAVQTGRTEPVSEAALLKKERSDQAKVDGVRIPWSAFLAKMPCVFLAPLSQLASHSDGGSSGESSPPSSSADARAVVAST